MKKKLWKRKKFCKLKKLPELLNILIDTCLGVMMGTVRACWLNYRQHPGLYALDSAPWRVGMLVPLAVELAALLLLVAARVVLGLRKVD